MKRIIPLLAGIAVLSGCAGMQDDLWYKVDARNAAAEKQAKAQQAKEAEAAAKYSDYYEVHDHGRIHVFDDFKTYQSYLQVGETAYRRSRIGAGPGGKTVVFGLTKQDKKKRSGVASEAMFDGKAKGVDNGFYAEVLYENRFYVFDRWDDLVSFKQVWEAPYRLTAIGEGSGGRTVVYVLNSGNKKKRPTALIAKYKALHGS